MKIHEFISEANWTQKALCRDQSGAQHHWPHGSTICQWCLGGMIIKCYPRIDDQQRIFDLISNKIGMVIHRWNDSPDRTWEDVRALAQELDI